MKLQYSYALLLWIPVVIILYFLLKKTFVKFRNQFEADAHKKETKFEKKLLLITRPLIFLLLLIAIASPFTFEEKVLEGDYSLTILADKSSSFELFEQDLETNLKKKIEKKVPVNIRYIAYGNNSPIGDSLLNTMQGNDNILLITDGNNNQGKDLGDIILLASLLNTTINSLDIEAKKDDTSVTIDVPPEVILRDEFTYYVNVDQVGERIPYRLNVTVDNDVVFYKETSGSKTFELKEYLTEGYHKISARLISVEGNDYFLENNVYYSTVHVLPRPRVLLVSKEFGKIEETLERVYMLDRKFEIPSNLYKYKAVIIDNMEAEELNPHIDKLSEYVSNGYGLVVIGGKNSFEYGGYGNSLFETLLPVTLGQVGVKEEAEVNVVLVIDISGTTTLSFSGKKEDTKISVQKAIALDLLNSLRPNDKIMAIAFDTKAHIIPPGKLLPKAEQPYLNNTIARISSDPTAGTFVYSGLQKANLYLENAVGSKNVVLISDGITALPHEAISIATLMANKGVKIYTIGVGEDTYEPFMLDLARTGKGTYFKQDETHRLSLMFNKTEEKKTDTNRLLIFNNHHFITNGLNLKGSITGYNQVVPKPSALTLITTQNINPILTVWRFGLGRIVVLSTDDGSRWAPTLLSKENSGTISRIVNWVIGNPYKDKNFIVRTKDTNLGSSTEIDVFSKKEFESEKLSFSKVGDNLYKGVFTPTTSGFHEFFDALVAVNYNKEYEKLGLNKELKDLVTITGGKTFNMDETDELTSFIRSVSKRKRNIIVYYRWPFIIAALVILLIEIAIRRLRENRKAYK